MAIFEKYQKKVVPTKIKSPKMAIFVKMAIF